MGKKLSPVSAKLKLVLRLKVKPKPSILKNEDGMFTLVRQDGTSAIYSLPQIKQFLEQEMKEGNTKVDKRTFWDFLRIHF